MPENIVRARGRGQNYKFDRGGMPSEPGPFIGQVKNNIDPTRGGRVQVYIEQFSGGDESDQSLWRTVSYIPPFYGVTNPGPNSPSAVGTFTTNEQSYGMWFTPPDIGTRVICFFVAGDPNQGYYVGCVPEPTLNHMIPAIGASRNFQLENGPQDSYFAKASQLPVTEINEDNESIFENPRFFDSKKPVHSYLASVMLQQGLITDTVRGPITSNSQRESPSSVYGISTPGKPIYQGGMNELDIKRQLERGTLLPQDIQVIARRGGHSVVMDDGDLEGKDNLVRIRTAKGHQITMSDNDDCFYIIHANGQTWIEFGKQGTVDVFSTNSVNVRTQGTINLHADQDINMFAGGSINMKSTVTKIQAEASLDLIGVGKLTAYSKNFIGLKSDGSISLQNSTAGSWNGGDGLNLKAGCINLNSGAGAPVPTPTLLRDYNLADVTFKINQGWVPEFGKLKTIVTRAPTHEPYPYHNQGVASVTELSEKSPQGLLGAVSSVLSTLTNTAVLDGIDTSAFLSQIPAEISVGSLNLPDVTGLMAQVVNDVGQSFTEITLDKGIGQFGFSASQLESSGFLKPGTVQTYLQDPAKLVSVLSSPSVWTGKSGVGELASLLADPRLQTITQNEIMITALDGLKSVGVITGNETPRDLAAFVQTAAKFGVNETLTWIQGAAPPDLVESINQVAKNAQYAVNFVSEKSSQLVTTGARLGGFTGTVERSAVDAAVSGIIGNNKVPLPDFGSGLYSGTPSSDLTYTGDDRIIWDRINSERIRRGLPGLQDIGYPRPKV